MRVDASPSTHTSIVSRQNSLARLSQARRVFDRLDWWALAAWAGSPLFHIDDEAALLFAPADLTPAQALHETELNAAWLRWCALADGTSASPLVPRMIDAAHVALLRAGIVDALAIAHPQDWLFTYLQDAGYRTIDRMLTFEIAPHRIADQPVARDVMIRDAFARDLPVIEQIDARCFAPAWRYPPATMQPAFSACRVFVLAEWRDAPVGYCCALLNEDHGHVVRLAVDVAHRTSGIGAALLAHVVHALAAHGASSVSLNTQGANMLSQRLYLRMGFVELIERPMVLHKPLAAPAGHGVGA
jgi:ribosomal protein S18 acetylase RimI-like enzyme